MGKSTRPFSFGLLDAAHCLSAMLPAAAMGADQIGIALQTPLVLSKTVLLSA